VDAAVFIALFLAGLLAGSELTSWGIVHPTLWKLEHASQVRAEKLMYRRFATVDPFLMTAAIVAAFVAAGALDGQASTLALAGGVCFTAMLTITLIGNMPINVRVLRWDEQSGDPDEWRRLRRRWDRLHSVRIVLDTAGFVLVALAAVHA
jgi:hypothetical protein